MPRIVYVLVSTGGLAGGHKMIVRHVETLRDLGFDAICYLGAASTLPTWFAHHAPVEQGTRLRPDDIVVMPDDTAEGLRAMAQSSNRCVVFTQNPYFCRFDDINAFPEQRRPTFIAVSPRLAATMKRAFPWAQVELVRCFADERLFRPGNARQPAVACVPRKRPFEAKAIESLFRILHPEHRGVAWRPLADKSEAEVAQALGEQSLFLSLSRLESVGMTTLEAMASGCLCAGFLGVGGSEYATPDNGFWAPEDDCEAAADALAEAAAVSQAGGSPLRRRLEAGYETARQWSYAAFRAELEATWMRLAPGARLQQGPLD